VSTIARPIDESHPGRAEAAPTEPAARLQLVDALRGFALLGILIVNLNDFSQYWGLTAEQKAQLPTAGTDPIAQFLRFMFGYGKFNTIFSFLFGLGFAMFLARAPERSAEFLRLYWWRLTILFAIGAVHMTFLWWGDIVALYAGLGFVFVPFRRVSDRALLACAAALIMSHPFLTLLIVLSNGALDPGAPLRQLSDWMFTGVFGFAPDSHAMVAMSGSWAELLKYNLTGPPYRLGDMLSSSRFQRVLAMFLVGLWAGRHMIFRDPAAHRRLFRQVLFWGLPISLLGNAVFAWMRLAGDEPSTVRDLVYAVSAVPLAMAYLAGLSLLWMRPKAQRWLAALAPAGRAALTVYLSQTIICIALFYGVGLGLGGRVGPTLFLPIALAIFAVQVALSLLWLRYFRFGPVEWVWRSLTYGRREPLRRRPVTQRVVRAPEVQA
jgi:uncharacterized protein